MTGTVTGRLVTDTDGGEWYRIEHVERMEPFLMTVVSDTDLWMFVSSAGPLTAGRVDADHALLPYETDDRLHRAAGVTGPLTLLVRTVDGARQVWRPFGRDLAPGCTRAVAKRTVGNALLLEEHNDAWELTFRMTWAPAPSHGWVRTVELIDRSGDGATLEVLDGLLDVMPAGVDAGTEQVTSNLVDAYKRSETGRWGTAAVYTLQSLITDRAEPAEALAATLVWSSGLDDATVHLDERVVDAVAHGREPAPRDLLTGRRGSYLLHAAVTIAPGASTSWQLVADTGLGHADVVDRVAAAARPDARETVERDITAGDRRLRDLLADADGFQTTGDRIADAHHLSNVLFNSMRGGVFPHGHRVPRADLLAFLADRNAPVHERWADDDLFADEWLDLDALRTAVAGTGDTDLLRLVLEYLPLTFSRRHGDPSRPWNRFAIRVRGDDGEQLLAYEGNWRDIFQNWEALLRSYPAWFPHVVAKFVNATTTDGHNAYRLSRDGIDWEVPEPHDPWSNIGYWGDHQIVYLLRLLEGWQAADPSGVTPWLDRTLFTYADVPYRLADHEAMVTNPRDTITYDHARAADVMARVEAIGADGRLVVDDRGDLVHVTLLEKLLVPALAKLSAYVPQGGIWMNTQRPEWNDANNALAGYGLSMVTLYHLERYVDVVAAFVADVDDDTVALSVPVAAWLTEIGDALAAAPPVAGDDTGRRRLLDALGRAGAAYRGVTADEFDTTTKDVPVAAVLELLRTAQEHLRASIAAGRRDDGLFHGYNLLSLGDGTASVGHLPPMLEGQVAALTTSAVDGDGAIALVDALFASPLLRDDLGTFMLYPATVPPAFLDRNTIGAEARRRVPALERVAAEGPPGIVEADHEGELHFGPDMMNAAVLRRALGATDLGDEEVGDVVDVYEELFDHHAFTGRSSGMFGYEGIGSIYWHMVSKLLLAVQEQHDRAVAADADAAVLEGLRAAYRRVRDGLGSRKDPATFGAIPTDCYSHTPAHAGAQQPGMTGQVKEEVLTRPAELGLRLAAGVLGTTTPLLPTEEVLGPDGTAACTVCATPVSIVAASDDEVVVTRHDGTVDRYAGTALSEQDSAAVLGRTGDVTHVEFRTRLT